MPLVVIDYRTKPNRADENEQLVGNVFAELSERAPAGVRYAAIRVGDRFLHIVDSAEDSSAIADLAAFKLFQAELAERVASPPNATPATLIGAYPPTFPYDEAEPYRESSTTEADVH